jgi:hypothetical protein
LAKKIILTETEIKNIQSLYLDDGYSTQTIANILGHSCGFIKKTLKDQGVNLRTLSQACNRIKNINNIFANIDNECSAYYLGLFFADGSIKKNNNCCELKLIECDRHILTTLSNLIYGVDRTIFVDYKKYKYAGNASNLYTLKVSSPEIKQSLISYGCVPKKSLILEFPALRYDLLRHFIRGYFDGDGCLTIDRSKMYKDFKLIITSTNNFCQSIKDIIGSCLDVNGRVKGGTKENNITKNLCIGGNRQILRFMNWLYLDANYFLNRKYTKYLELKAACEDIDKRHHNTSRKIIYQDIV